MKKTFLLLSLLLLSVIVKSAPALTTFAVKVQYLQNGKILLSQASNTIEFNVTVTRGYINGSLESPISFSVKLVYRQSGQADIDLCPYNTITTQDFNGSYADKTYSATISSDKTAGNVYLVYSYYDYANSITVGPTSSSTFYATYKPTGGGTTNPIGNNIIKFVDGLNSYVYFKVGDNGNFTGNGTDQQNYVVYWQYADNPEFTQNFYSSPSSSFLIGTDYDARHFDNTKLYNFSYAPGTKRAFFNPNKQWIPGTVYIRRTVGAGSTTSYSNVLVVEKPNPSPAPPLTGYNITAQKKALDPNYHHPLGDDYIDVGIQSPKVGVTYNIYAAFFEGEINVGTPTFPLTVMQFSASNSIVPTKATSTSDLIYITVKKDLGLTTIRMSSSEGLSGEFR